MKFLVVSQVFWPDTASVAQHLFDICEVLAEKGHEVEVFSGNTAYEDPTIRYPKKEIYKKIKITRLQNTSFGKSSMIGRILDFMSFNLLVFIRLLPIKKKSFDTLLTLTSPPLLPFFCSLISIFKKIPLYYWAMDLQPELSIHSGLIKKNSIKAKIFSFLGDFSLKRSTKIISLDEQMKSYLEAKTPNKKKVVQVVPVWPVLRSHYLGKRVENPFRLQNRFGDKIVIMYSGNHSFVSPLDTLLETAKNLKNNSKFIFVFIGEGVQKKKVSYYRVSLGCHNILQLPYQPLAKVHISLASADYQVVTMGNEIVGYTHPNKVYGAMYAGRKIIYIGPSTSFIEEILNKCSGNISVRHGQTKELKEKILLDQQEGDSIVKQGEKNLSYAKKHFDPLQLKEKMYGVLVNT